jgi:hypothetical protein
VTRTASFGVAVFAAIGVSVPASPAIADEAATPAVSSPAGREHGGPHTRSRSPKPAARRKMRASHPAPAPPAEHADPAPAPSEHTDHPDRTPAPGILSSAPVAPLPEPSEGPSEGRTGGDADPATPDAVAGAPRGSTHHVGRELFTLSVGIEAGMRHFSYNMGLTPNLRPYSLNGAPLAATGAEIYPLAGAYAVDAGLVLAYAQAFATQSATVDAGNLQTRWTRYTAGGRVRLRTSGDQGPVFGLTGAYGSEQFLIESWNPNASLPAVDYRFVRASADARVPFGRFAAFGDVGYLFVLSAGDVAARFPRSSVGGVQAELGAAVAIAAGFEARVTASYRRFFYTMNPTPGDGYVAGGALDELSGLQASVAYVY